MVITTIASGSSTPGPHELAGRRDPVQAGHPDVEQAHIRPQPHGRIDRFQAVGRLTDHLDTRLRIEDHRESRPDEILVVGDEHADRHRPTAVRGSTTSTDQPRSESGPAANVPPSSVARSVIPTKP